MMVKHSLYTRGVYYTLHIQLTKWLSFTYNSRNDCRLYTTCTASSHSVSCMCISLMMASHRSKHVRSDMVNKTMFSMYRPVVYGDGGLIAITACVCVCELDIFKFKPSDVSNPAEYRSTWFLPSIHRFPLFRCVCVCVCVCVGGRERNGS
jgi:hypothetical protein